MTSSHFETFDNHKADYAAAQHNRFNRRRTGLPAGGGNADFHLRNESDFYRIIETARDIDRNDPILGQVLDRAVSNTIQDGFTILPETGDKDLDDELWYMWKDWSEDADQCDLAGERTWAEFETAALRSQLLDGDCVLKAVRDGQLEFFEAHQVGTTKKHKNTFLGVTTNNSGQRTDYWIGPGRNGAFGSNKHEANKQYSTRSGDGLRLIFHPMNRKRISATRGVTALAPIIGILGMIEDINFAKLVQQQIVSCFAILRERSVLASNPLPKIGGQPEYADQHNENVAGVDTLVDELAPGMEVIGMPGETLKGFSPKVPNAEFFQQFRLQIAMVGANLGLAPCQVLLDFSEENFVGYRGALHEARRSLKSNQRSLAKRLHKPVYDWKLTQFAESEPAIAAARQRLGDKLFFRCKVQPPAFDYLEPINDAAADLLRVRNGLTSRRRMHAERMQDWQEIADESIDDNAYAIEIAMQRMQKLRDQYPDLDPPHWRDLIALPTPDGLQIGLTSNNDQNGGKAKAKPSTQSQPPMEDDDE